MAMHAVWPQLETNKTDISYLKTSRVFFYTNHSTEGCVQQQVSLSLMQLAVDSEWIRQSHYGSESADTAIS